MAIENININDERDQNDAAILEFYTPTPEGIASMLVDACVIAPADEEDAYRKLARYWFD